MCQFLSVPFKPSPSSAFRPFVLEPGAPFRLADELDTRAADGLDCEDGCGDARIAGAGGSARRRRGGSDHLAARIGPPCSRERENLIAKRANLGEDALFQGGPFNSGKKKCINVTQFEIQYAA